MVIRWLGAYGKGGSLAESLRWELTGPLREVCAEPCGKGLRDCQIEHSRVGLVVARHAVVRVAPGDVWSKHDENGFLKPTRRPRDTHGEAFCRPIYRAIIYRGRISKTAYKAVMKAASEYGLPVIRQYPDGQIKEVWKPQKKTIW